MVFMSDAIFAITGYPAHDFLYDGVRTFADLIHPDDLAMVEHANTKALHSKKPFEIEYRIFRADQSLAWIYEKGQGVYDEDGVARWIDGVIFDITERKHAAELQRQASQQHALIQAQAATIAELSAPLIPMSESVLVMPLIGSIDAARAEQILVALLEGITNQNVTAVIVDITGITLIDTHVAGTLINAAKGARLLGAEIILTGIRPEVAQTMVSLGVQFEGIITESTLQRGISAAMRGQLL